MTSLLIWATTLLQGAQLTSGGSITGTLKAQNGAPAANVRVVAMSVPNSARRGAGFASFAKITQTDSAGNYSLDNISPGRYYIAAGPVTFQTFHPGTTLEGSASIVTVAPDAPPLSGVDFTVSNTPGPARGAFSPATQQMTGVICCELKVRFRTEDGNGMPNFPNELTVIDARGGGRAFTIGTAYWELGFYPITFAVNTTIQVGLDGLPPGYVLKSVAYGGKDFGLNPILIDGKSPGTLDFILGTEPVSALKKVTVRGKMINAPAEFKEARIRFVSTMPNGPAIVAKLQPDGSFEAPEIPVGAYRTEGFVVRTVVGPLNTSTILVIRDNIADLTIDLRNSLFPEFDGVPPEHSTFSGGKATKITGVITEKLTRIGKNKAAYFRMNVKDPTTGIATPWVIYVEDDGLVPAITVGETITVPGTPSTDGTNRFVSIPF